MTDILDYLRDRLAERPDVLPAVEPVLDDARKTFGGDTVYVRMRPMNELAKTGAKPAKTPAT